MRQDFWYPSKGEGNIHACRWLPEGKPKAIVQIVHGIAEFAERYEDFACFLAEKGILVVAEDHMGHGQSVNGDGIRGYFHGCWFTAVADTMQLMEDTKAANPVNICIEHGIIIIITKARHIIAIESFLFCFIKDFAF